MSNLSPQERNVTVSLEEYSILSERGRAVAEQALIDDPARKARVEAVYGLEYCQRRYPRAYGLDAKPVLTEPLAPFPSL